MPSFGHGVDGARRTGAGCWSRSRRRAASARCRPGPGCRSAPARPETGDRCATERPSPAPAGAWRRPVSHDQVLRNHAVGSTCSVSASGPALVTRTRISTSVGSCLGVVDFDDPVAVVVEGARVEQLVLWIELSAPAVLVDQVLVRKRALRVVVAPAVPGVAGDRVQVPPVFFGVLAVVAPARRSGPKIRSFRIGSRPFQSASPRHRRCSMSEKPARPSSPHRYARERA